MKGKERRCLHLSTDDDAGDAFSCRIVQSTTSEGHSLKVLEGLLSRSSRAACRNDARRNLISAKCSPVSARQIKAFIQIRF